MSPFVAGPLTLLPQYRGLSTRLITLICEYLTGDSYVATLLQNSKLARHTDAFIILVHFCKVINQFLVQM